MRKTFAQNNAQFQSSSGTTIFIVQNFKMNRKTLSLIKFLKTYSTIIFVQKKFFRHKRHTFDNLSNIIFSLRNFEMKNRRDRER